MNSKVYKWCAVPLCKNTSIVTPNKLFVYVPNKKIVRDKWLQLARRDPADVVLNSPIYFCEDHFDLPNDMENYMQYHLMGKVSQVRMKPGCMPKKFACQIDRETRTSDTIEQPYIRMNKKRKKVTIEECEKQCKESSMGTEHSDVNENASRSSVEQNLEEAAQATSIIDKSIQDNMKKKTYKRKINQKTKIRLVNPSTLLQPHLVSGFTSPFQNNQNVNSKQSIPSREPLENVSIKQLKRVQNKQTCTVKSNAKKCDYIPKKLSLKNIKKKKEVIPENIIISNESGFNQIEVSKSSTSEMPAIDYDTSETVSATSSITDLETINEPKEITDVVTESEMEEDPLRIASPKLKLEKSQFEELYINETHSLNNEGNIITNEYDKNNTKIPMIKQELSFPVEFINSNEIKKDKLKIVIDIPCDQKFYSLIPEEYHSLINHIYEHTEIEEECIILCLNKIIFDTSFTELKELVNRTHPGTIFENCIPIIAKALLPFIMKPTKNEVRKKLPIIFRHSYNDIYTIIDVLEIQVINARHSGTDTMKYVVCTTPDGLINHISPGFIENTIPHVLHCSNFSDHFEPGASILINDMDMKIIDYLKLPNHVKVVKLSEHRPISCHESIKSIHHAQKMVENITKYIKILKKRFNKFSMLNSILVNRDLICLLDDIVLITCALINCDLLENDL